MITEPFCAAPSRCLCPSCCAALHRYEQRRAALLHRNEQQLHALKRDGEKYARERRPTNQETGNG